MEPFFTSLFQPLRLLDSDLIMAWFLEHPMPSKPPLPMG